MVLQKQGWDFGKRWERIVLAWETDGLLLAIRTAGAGENQRMGRVLDLRFGGIWCEQSPGSLVQRGLVPPGLRGGTTAPAALGECGGTAVV